MSENKESPGMKIFIQVVGAVLTAVILFLIGINTNGGRAKVSEKEMQQQVAQPNINVTNEIEINNKAQNNDMGRSSEPRRGEKITELERLKESESANTEGENKKKYSSEVKDENGNGVANVEIYCSNCIVNNVKTDENGKFQLEGYFKEDASFWKSTIRLSKDKKSKIETIDWREKSPESINF